MLQVEPHSNLYINVLTHSLLIHVIYRCSGSTINPSFCWHWVSEKLIQLFGLGLGLGLGSGLTPQSGVRVRVNPNPWGCSWCWCWSILKGIPNKIFWFSPTLAVKPVNQFLKGWGRKESNHVQVIAMAGKLQQLGKTDNLAKIGWRLVSIFTLWRTEWGAAGYAGDEVRRSLEDVNSLRAARGHVTQKETWDWNVQKRHTVGGG